MDEKALELSLLATLALLGAIVAYALDDFFSARSLPHSVLSPFSAPQPRGTGADMGQLVLKHASASRPSGRWNDDEYDVLADGVVVGRVFKVRLGGRTPWMWTLASGHHEYIHTWL